MYSLACPCGLECRGHHFCQVLPYWPDTNQVKFMNTSTKHILQCNQSEPLADASGMIEYVINENGALIAGSTVSNNSGANETHKFR